MNRELPIYCLLVVALFVSGCSGGGSELTEQTLPSDTGSEALETQAFDLADSRAFDEGAEQVRGGFQMSFYPEASSLDGLVGLSDVIFIGSLAGYEEGTYLEPADSDDPWNAETLYDGLVFEVSDVLKGTQVVTGERLVLNTPVLIEDAETKGKTLSIRIADERVLDMATGVGPVLVFALFDEQRGLELAGYEGPLRVENDSIVGDNKGFIFNEAEVVEVATVRLAVQRTNSR